MSKDKSYISTALHSKRDKYFGRWSHGPDRDYRDFFDKHAEGLVLSVIKTDYGDLSLRVVEIITLYPTSREVKSRLKKMYRDNFGLRDIEEIRIRMYDKDEAWIYEDRIKEMTGV